MLHRNLHFDVFLPSPQHQSMHVARLAAQHVDRLSEGDSLHCATIDTQ